MEIVDDTTTLIGHSPSKSTTKSRDIRDEETCDTKSKSKSKESSTEIKSNTRKRKRDNTNIYHDFPRSKLIATRTTNSS